MAPKRRKMGLVYDFRAPGLTGTLQLESPEALKALGHPLRSSLLKELRLPLSAKEVAAELDVPVARLYHHLKLLEKHGLVVVAGERRAGSNTEKLYRIAAARIEIAGTVDGEWDDGAGAGSERLERGQRTFREAVEAADAARDERDGECRDPMLEPWLVEAVARLDPEQARRLVAALADVLRDLRIEVDRSSADPGTRFGLQLIFTPFPDGKGSRWAETRHWDPDSD